MTLRDFVIVALGTLPFLGIEMSPLGGTWVASFVVWAIWLLVLLGYLHVTHNLFRRISISSPIDLAIAVRWPFTLAGSTESNTNEWVAGRSPPAGYTRLPKFIAAAVSYTENIILVEPTDGSTVRPGLMVRGYAKTHEGNVVVEDLQSDGRWVTLGVTTAKEDYEYPAPFSTTVWLNEGRAYAEDWRIECL